MTAEPIRSEPEQYGALAAALAKAQAAFPAIQRDKEVVVKTKTGGEYRFKYAPLDTILTATRGPLSDNGLALVQLLDDGELVTMLLHSSGARLSGRVALPTEVDIQGLGSAITYLRRYSLQAILGIAAEEDDDGNRASGNTTTPSAPGVQTEELVGELTRTGTIERGDGNGSDLQAHVTPDGHLIGFALKTTKGRIAQVWAQGDLAETLFAAASMDTGKLLKEKATVHGLVYNVRQPARTTFQRLKLSRIEVLGVIIPPNPITPIRSPEAEAALAPAQVAYEAEIATETNEPSGDEQADLDAASDALWPDVVKA